MFVSTYVEHLNTIYFPFSDKSTINTEKQVHAVPGRSHKAYFPTERTSSSTNIVLLMLYL
jgi:hypothetical protein